MFAYTVFATAGILWAIFPRIFRVRAEISLKFLTAPADAPCKICKPY